MEEVKKVYLNGAVLVNEDNFNEGLLSKLAGRTVFQEERFLLAAVAETLGMSGYKSTAAEKNARLGIVLGVDTVVDSWKAGFFGEVIKDGPIGASPLAFPYTSPNALAARATIAFNIKGDDITISSGALSFLKAVSYGALLVESGVLDGVVVGGIAEGVAFTALLSTEPCGNYITEIFEQRVAGDGLVQISTMAESFKLFKEVLETASSYGRGGEIRVRDPEGNTVGMTIACSPSQVSA